MARTAVSTTPTGAIRRGAAIIWVSAQRSARKIQSYTAMVALSGSVMMKRRWWRSSSRVDCDAVSAVLSRNVQTAHIICQRLPVLYAVGNEKRQGVRKSWTEVQEEERGQDWCFVVCQLLFVTLSM